MGEELVFDGIDEGDEEILEGDTGPTLVVRLRNNIFQSTCTIEGNVCHFVIDAGSCENIISTGAV